MTVQKIKELLDAQVLCGESLLEREVHTACGSDMMSDVLAFTKRNTLLCTGLTNMQVVRTADMTELSAVVFVRGKVPDNEIVEAAAEDMLPILVTECTLFEACGILYGAGISGCNKRGKRK